VDWRKVAKWQIDANSLLPESHSDNQIITLELPFNTIGENFTPYLNHSLSIRKY
jgi:hypothetical protein